MNLFLLFLSLMCRVQTAGVDTTAMETPCETTDTIGVAAMQCCDFSISTERADISGMLITRRDSDGNVAGSLINEFGFSALDFNYSTANRKLKLISITDFLDKWYIRRVLKEDLRHCLNMLLGIDDKPTGHHHIATEEDGHMTLVNSKRKLTYRFSPLKPYNSHETAR